MSANELYMPLWQTFSMVYNINKMDRESISFSVANHQLGARLYTTAKLTEKE